MQFACCGVDSYDDWKSSNWHLVNQNISFPDSCCKSLKYCDNTFVNQIYTDGCYPAILNLLTENISSLALGTFLISIFQVSGQGEVKCSDLTTCVYYSYAV